MKIYNSIFEISLRILILLDTYHAPLSLDEIKQIDILSTYCKQYGMGETNLHGDTSYTLSEVASRRELINEALKKLVLQGHVEITTSKNGFTYSISKTGTAIHWQMTSDYALEYEKSLKQVIKTISNMSSKEVNNLLYNIGRRN